MTTFDFVNRVIYVHIRNGASFCLEHSLWVTKAHTSEAFFHYEKHVVQELMIDDYEGYLNISLTAVCECYHHWFRKSCHAKRTLKKVHKL